MSLTRAVRWALLLALFGATEIATRQGLIRPLILPPPTEIVRTMGELIPHAQFRNDLRRTLFEVGASFVLGASLGAMLGAACWRLRLLGDSLEPYLVTFYAMPLVAFYPILLALLGIGVGPIIVLASLGALVPVTLNTMVALRSISPVLEKMGRSMSCSRGQLYRKVLLPAAVPLAVPGFRLGFVYSFIGCIAMEFILAPLGIGYRIGVYYRQFEIAEMWAMIVVVGILAIAVTSTMSAAERRIRKDML